MRTGRPKVALILTDVERANPHLVHPLVRVADRVRGGGHDVPAATVRRRYRAGLRNFFHLYEPLASTWRLYDASAPEPRLVAARLEVQPLKVYDEHIWSIVRHQGTA